MPGPADVKSDDYYRVLGVDRKATDAEISKAYKQLALRHHPDKNQDSKEEAEENFKRITEAYDVLHDPEKRRGYDQLGKAGCTGGGPGGPGGGFHCGHPGMSRQRADEVFNVFFGGEDPFSVFFGNDGGMGMFGNMQGGKGGPGARRMGSGMPHGPPGGMNFGPDIFGDMNGGGFPGMPRRSGSNGGNVGWRPNAPAHVLSQGTRVVIRGLTKAAEHNGKTGKIIRWDETQRRYEVDMSGERISLKQQNLTQLCSVEVVALENKPQLNGKTGEIFNYEEGKGRYTVLIGSPALAVALLPGNCVLPQGTPVMVQGLSNEQFNGQMAQITSIDRATARYTVQCENGQQIKIKLDNVVC